MDDAKKERLAKNGWTVGTVSEFLDLTSEEATLVEIKLALSRHLKQRRQQLMTQTALAERLQSSQPRIAKAENGDASVSIELLIKAILATGATPQEIGQVIAQVG
ncbi:MAG: helix-turn-helix transcriptional regulator [Cyanobacteria bacterium CAN_BIN43]|jgi:predicted XRE-type DNA-binding protein|nr:helix-turn-helix transcriptional regulator [Cyanobacteria bacterium CAN_BIN43]